MTLSAHLNIPLLARLKHVYITLISTWRMDSVPLHGTFTSPIPCIPPNDTYIHHIFASDDIVVAAKSNAMIEMDLLDRVLGKRLPSLKVHNVQGHRMILPNMHTGYLQFVDQIHPPNWLVNLLLLPK